MIYEPIIYIKFHDIIAIPLIELHKTVFLCVYIFLKQWKYFIYTNQIIDPIFNMYVSHQTVCQ